MGKNLYLKKALVNNEHIITKCLLQFETLTQIAEIMAHLTDVILEDHPMQHDIIIGCDYINQDHVVSNKIDNTVQMKNKNTSKLISKAELNQCSLK